MKVSSIKSRIKWMHRYDTWCIYKTDKYICRSTDIIEWHFVGSHFITNIDLYVNVNVNVYMCTRIRILYYIDISSCSSLPLCRQFHFIFNAIQTVYLLFRTTSYDDVCISIYFIHVCVYASVTWLYTDVERRCSFTHTLTHTRTYFSVNVLWGLGLGEVGLL